MWPRLSLLQESYEADFISRCSLFPLFLRIFDIIFLRFAGFRPVSRNQQPASSAQEELDSSRQTQGAQEFFSLLELWISAALEDSSEQTSRPKPGGERDAEATSHEGRSAEVQSMTDCSWALRLLLLRVFELRSDALSRFALATRAGHALPLIRFILKTCLDKRFAVSGSLHYLLRCVSAISSRRGENVEPES